MAPIELYRRAAANAAEVLEQVIPESTSGYRRQMSFDDDRSVRPRGPVLGARRTTAG